MPGNTTHLSPFATPRPYAPGFVGGERDLNKRLCAQAVIDATPQAVIDFAAGLEG